MNNLVQVLPNDLVVGRQYLIKSENPKFRIRIATGVFSHKFANANTYKFDRVNMIEGEQLPNEAIQNLFHFASGPPDWTFWSQPSSYIDSKQSSIIPDYERLASSSTAGGRRKRQSFKRKRRRTFKKRRYSRRTH